MTFGQRRKITCVFAFLLLFVTALTLSAQTGGTASLQGAVTDPTGAAISGANVTITNTDTKVARNTVTDTEGRYSLPNIPPGPYSLTVSATSFKGYSQTGLVLEVGSSITINPSLSVGTSTETVEVAASGVAIETESATYKQVIDQKRITELPLNGRQATQLVLLTGGSVVAPSSDMVGSKNYITSVVISVAGSQGNYNNYLLDGGGYTDNFTNVNLPFPFPDALQEFSVESNSLPARNGLHPGALINAVTRSGTNQWHGSAFEFIRNNIVNATNFFSGIKDTVKRNQFGGTIGGKVVSDKAFFFFGYQGTRNRQVSAATNSCIPTAAELAGDFSQMPAVGAQCGRAIADNGNLYDPATNSKINTNPNQANYRKIPTSSLSQTALNLVKYLPASLANPTTGAISVAIPANFTEDQYIGRFDYNISSNHNLFFRTFVTNYNAPAYFSPTNLLLTTTAGNDQRVMAYTLGDTLTLTPHLVNSAHASYTRRRNNRGPTAGGINARTIGVNIFTYVPADLRLSVTNQFSVGCGTCSPGFFNVNTETFSDDVDWIKGKHQIAFGGEYIRTGDNTNSGYLQNGNFSFSGAASGGQYVGGGAATSAGEPMIDFLTGKQNSFGQSRQQQTSYRQNIFSLYAQDTFHFNSHLTLSLGVRYEPMLYQTDKFGRGSTFDQAAFSANTHSTVFPKAPAGIFFYGDNGVPKSFTNNRWNNFSPRFSLSYDPIGNGKTVFRAGSAIMYDSPNLFTSQRLTSSPPFVNEIAVTGPVDLTNPYANYSGGNPFPGTFPPDASATFPTNAYYVLLPRNIRTPTIYQWTASVQQDLGRGWMMSVSYLGNHNAHLWLGRAINPATYIQGTWTGPGSCGALTVSPGTGTACSTTGNAAQRTVLALANPTQGAYFSPTMTSISDGFDSNYNGVIAAIQHRMSNSFSLLTNYTWSHCISVGDAPGDVAGIVNQNPYYPRGDRANCGFDVRHIFNTSIVASSNFKSLNPIARAVVNDWQLSPIIRILSGVPMDIMSGIDNSRNGQGRDRPNYVPGIDVYTHNHIQRQANLAYLNKAAFTQNSVGTFGNVGRNAFRGPKYYNLDLSLSRNFQLYERLKLQMRLEGFNVFNHPFFGTSGGSGFTTTLSSGTFGNATAAYDPRIFQAAAKFTF
ncbi:MAG TPA: TonB-dependent receptor [Bryobacteraceae bacterium]